MPSHYVTNIKFSFKSRSRIAFLRKSPYIHEAYTKNNNFIMKTKFGVYSILGRNLEFVNCTGVRDREAVVKCILFLCEITNVRPSDLHTFNIDCLATKIRLEPGLKSRFHEKKSENFHLVKTTKFPATIFKLRCNGAKISLSYFNRRGVAIVNGLKKIEFLDFVIKMLKKDFGF